MGLYVKGAFDETRAAQDCARIEAFWRERGATVKTWVEGIGFQPKMRQAVFCPRSDLRNGLPVSPSRSVRNHEVGE